MHSWYTLITLLKVPTVGGWSFGVLNSLLVKNSTPSAEQQSLIFFMMHHFAISSGISVLFLIQGVSLYRLLRKKSRNGTTDFRSADRLLFIIIKDPLFFLFAPLGFLGSIEPRLFSPSSPCTSYRLLDMLRNRLFASRRFPMLCSSFLCKLIKEWRSMKVVKHP